MPIFRQKSHFNRAKCVSDDESENDDVAQIEVLPDHLVREKKDGGFNFNPIKKMRKQQGGESENAGMVTKAMVVHRYQPYFRSNCTKTRLIPMGHNTEL